MSTSEREYAGAVTRLADLPPLEVKAVLADLRTLTAGVNARDARMEGVTRYERFDLLGSLNQTVRRLVAAINPRVQWTDADTGRIIRELLATTSDDDFSRRGLLAVKILSGWRRDPETSTRVSPTDPNVTWGYHVDHNPSLFAGGATFRSSKKIRQLFAAPLYGGSTANHFVRDHPNFFAMAEEFIDEVFRRAETLARDSDHPANRATRSLPAERAPEELEPTESDVVAGNARSEPDGTNPDLPNHATELQTRSGDDSETGTERAGRLGSAQSRVRTVLLCGAGVAAIALAVAMGTAATGWIGSLSEAPPASSAEGETQDGSLAHSDDVVSTFHQVPLDPRCPAPRPMEENATQILLAEPGGCWTSSVRLTDDSRVYAFVLHKNSSSGQQDEVTASLRLPDGVRVVDNSTYWGNYSQPTGTFAFNGELEGHGVDAGSYGPGANVWWLVALERADEGDACAHEIRAAVTSKQLPRPAEVWAYISVLPCE